MNKKKKGNYDSIITIIFVIYSLVILLVIRYLTANAESQSYDIPVGKPKNSAIAGITKSNMDTLSYINKKNLVIGYINDGTYIRSEPNMQSDLLLYIHFKDEIMCSEYNDEWMSVIFVSGNGLVEGYIQKEYVSKNPLKFKTYNVPNNSGFKSYMPYDAITDVNSRQYELQKWAYTNQYGLRIINERYCVAVGTAFGANIGDYADLILENGEVIPVIVSDIKADIDTYPNNIVTMANGCVSEFLVSDSLLSSDISTHGDVSVSNENWNSKVVKIVLYEQNFLDKGDLGEYED